MTTLSCVVPVSRMANELGELESWIRDSLSLDIEIVIVHDIQDNETAEQLGSLIENLQDNRVRLIQEDVNSPGLARNLGLRIAQGQWIAFWDSDDLPDAKEALASINENLDAEIIIGRYITHERRSGSEEVSSESDLNQRKVGINPGMWRMIFRKSVLVDKEFSAIKMAEDQVFIAELNLDSRLVSFTSRVLYKYFKGRPNQLTNSELRITDFLTAFELILIAQKQQKSPLHSINFVMLSRILVTTFKRFGISGLLRLSERLDRSKLKVTFREKCAIGINIVGIVLQRIQK